MFKNRVLHSALIGKPFNSEFDITESNAKFVGPINAKTFQSITEGIIGINPETNKGSNKEIFDTNTAQQLTSDKISALQTEGIVGKDLVEELVENSATFGKKTVYSQEKYIKKKEKKYIKKFFVYSPTVRMLCGYFMEHAPKKINSIRFDTLGLMLHMGDIQPGSIVTVNENASGLVLAAVAERMGGEGSINYVYTDNKIELEILSKLNITSSQKKNIIYTNMKTLLETGTKPALFDTVIKEQERGSSRYLPRLTHIACSSRTRNITPSSC